MPNSKGDVVVGTTATPIVTSDSKKTKTDTVSGDALPPDPNTPYIAGEDSFGSTQLNEVTLREALGPEHSAWIAKGLKNEPGSVELEMKLGEKLKKRFGFAQVWCSVIQYFEPGNLAIYITWDVVEQNDVARRMPFDVAPTGEFVDPEGLIHHWMDYENTGLKLIASGEIDSEGTPCAALHCPFGHTHPQTKKYEKIFVEGVPKNEKWLASILSKDRRAEYRASAAYLLAYLKDGKKVVGYMADRIKDPEDLVRNNALRVLGDIAEFHPEYVIPIRPVMEALHFPRVTDRSKSVYVVENMVANSKEARVEVLKNAVPDLLKIMDSKQPDHRELAHAVLRKVSGKEYAATDLRSWNRWYTKLHSENRTVSGKQ